ncbi:hypothetical protein FALBO_5606 [Fusarium albosuccineum]|uniref:Uncharacterized protein n=1 Tax=Fusarium albosuccineum TaxID=1237068 RepID=A0A8H4PE41_9HYPO|nr:hypothetical protein FALBO_5606 [Fusarium albosuccineum]
MSIYTLDDIVLIIRQPLSTPHSSHSAGSLIRLESARLNIHDIAESVVASPSAYSWDILTSLLTSNNAPAGASDDLKIRAELPQPTQGQPVDTTVLDSPGTFQRWLGCILSALQRRAYIPGLHGPIGLHPTGDLPQHPSSVPGGRTVAQSAPRRPSPPLPPPPRKNAPQTVIDLTESDEEVDSVRDATDGLLSNLYQTLTIRDEAEAKEAAELFQLPSLDPPHSTTKIITGFNRGRPLRPWQLLGIYALIKRVVSDAILLGQYLADPPGGGKTLLAVCLIGVYRTMRLIREHIDDYPELHNQPPGSARSCNLSAQFGLQCLCVQGSLLAQWEQKLPEDGFTFITCESYLISEWAREFDHNVCAEIDEPGHPFHGRMFLRAFKLTASDNFAPVPGHDDRNNVAAEQSNFAPELGVFLQPGESSLVVKKTPEQLAKAPQTVWIENWLEPGKFGFKDTQNSWMSHSWAGIPAGKKDPPDLSDPLTTADSSIVLLMSRGLLESRSKRDAFRSGGDVMVRPEGGSTEQAISIRMVAKVAFVAAILVHDEAHQRVSADCLSYKALLQNIQLNSQQRNGSKYGPYVLLLSGTPFPAKLAEICNMLNLLSWDNRPVDALRKRLAGLENMAKRQTHEPDQEQDDEGGRTMLDMTGNVKQEVQQISELLSRWMMGRTHDSSLWKDGYRIEDNRPKRHDVKIERRTPDQCLRKLDRMRSHVAQDFRASSGASKQVMDRLTRSVAWTPLLRAGSVALLLEEQLVGDNRFPITYNEIEKDLSSDSRQSEGIRGERKSQKPKSPRGGQPERIVELAHNPDMLKDLWFDTLLKICRMAQNGQVYSEDDEGTTAPAIDCPRHIIIFCPSPLVTYIVYHFLRHHLNDEAICHILTAYFPGSPTKRNKLVAQWAGDAGEIDARAINSSTSRPPKVIIGVVSIRVACTGMNTMTFASIGIIFGEPSRGSDREQAIARLHRMGQQREVVIYQFRRTDNPALLATEDSNNRRNDLCIGRFDIATTNE